MKYIYVHIYIYISLQMNSRRSTRGCPRATSWTCRPSSTCGRWTLRSSGATSSWRPACALCPGALRESSSSCLASAKDATGSLKSICRENGQHKTAFRHLYSCLGLVCVCVCVCLYKQTAYISRGLVLSCTNWNLIWILNAHFIVYFAIHKMTIISNRQ